MIEFSVSFIEFVLATFIPICIGMFSVVALSNITQVNTRYFSAYALGLLFWFFFDTMNDAVQLGVNDGYAFGFHQTGLVVLFITGFLLVALLGGRSPRKQSMAKASIFPLLLAMLVGLGMSIHGIGEGLEFGGTAAGTQATSVLDAIGGVGGGLSYVLHKLLESTIVIVVFVALARTQDLSIRKQLWQTVIVGLAFGIPSVIGEAVAYYVPIDSSYFFAMGGGAALSVILQVIRPIFEENNGKEVTYSQWIRISLAVLLGFFLFYGAALFHS
ncbi:MAG: hypothetical protein ABSD49_01985 [Candidatus Bathyarchaeia archaeon]|jgi:hypothetical protein